jgi:hypothetical protein
MREPFIDRVFPHAPRHFPAQELLPVSRPLLFSDLFAHLLKYDAAGQKSGMKFFPGFIPIGIADFHDPARIRAAPTRDRLPKALILIAACRRAVGAGRLGF